MTGRTFLDTNVAVYAYDDDDPTKQHIASAVLENGRASVVSTQVLAEFYVTVTRKIARPLSSEEGREATMRLAEFPVVPHDRALVLEAIHLANRHQLSLWDAMIIRAAATAGCERVLTEDLADAAIYDGVEIENPFA